MVREVGVLSVIKNDKESEFEWKIEDPSFRRSYSDSPSFQFEGESWMLKLFTKDKYKWLGLFRTSPCRFVRSLSGSPTEVEFSVAIITTQGKKSFEKRQRHCFELIRFYCFEKWITMRDLYTRPREFLSFGCLTIILTMKRVESGKSESEKSTLQPSDSQHKDETIQDLKKLLLSQENCDVILKVQGQKFSAHQAVLTAKSPVFASLFRNNMWEKEIGTVDIEDVDPSCFPQFLHFLYCGEVEKLSAANAHSLFFAADKYQIMDLRTMCVEFMKNNLYVDTFCDTLGLAILHTETELIDSCTEYFVQNAEKVLATVKWQKFAAENPTKRKELIMKYVHQAIK